MIKIITVGSTVYLGELKETEKKTTIQKSLSLGAISGVNKAHLAQYIKAENTDTLEKDIVITGNGATFTQRELPDDLALEYEVLCLKMKQAQKLAPRELENQKFDKLLIGG